MLGNRIALVSILSLLVLNICESVPQPEPQLELPMQPVRYLATLGANGANGARQVSEPQPEILEELNDFSNVDSSEFASQNFENSPIFPTVDEWRESTETNLKRSELRESEFQNSELRESELEKKELERSDLEEALPLQISDRSPFTSSPVSSSPVNSPPANSSPAQSFSANSFQMHLSPIHPSPLESSTKENIKSLELSNDGKSTLTAQRTEKTPEKHRSMKDLLSMKNPLSELKRSPKIQNSDTEITQPSRPRPQRLKPDTEPNGFNKIPTQKTLTIPTRNDVSKIGAPVASEPGIPGELAGSEEIEELGTEPLEGEPTEPVLKTPFYQDSKVHQILQNPKENYQNRFKSHHTHHAKLPKTNVNFLQRQFGLLGLQEMPSTKMKERMPNDAQKETTFHSSPHTEPDLQQEALQEGQDQSLEREKSEDLITYFRRIYPKMKQYLDPENDHSMSNTSANGKKKSPKTTWKGGTFVRGDKGSKLRYSLGHHQADEARRHSFGEFLKDFHPFSSNNTLFGHYFGHTVTNIGSSTVDLHPSISGAAMFAIFLVLL